MKNSEVLNSKRFLILLISLFIFSSCAIKPSTTTSGSSSTITSSYSKDDEGFFILEDDYFVSTSIEDDKETTNIKIPSKTTITQYSNMRLYIGDRLVPLYNVKTNFSNTWNATAPNRMDNAVATIELKGKVTFKLQTNFSIKDNCTIRPLNANIEPSIDDERRVVTFTISSPGQYTVEFSSDRTLHLFINEYDVYKEYKSLENVIYFAEGIHNKDNDSRIDFSNNIYLSSNSVVYLEMGAIVQGSFLANNKTNISIVGSGIVDGSIFVRDATQGNYQKQIPYDFLFCSNLTFKGITTLDPAGWCYNIYFCDEVTFDNVKIISSRSNGDGISLQSSSNVNCTNTFVRAWDDALVVKNYPKNGNVNDEGSTRNITFQNCIIWTDLAQSLEIGYETYGKMMQDIHFENITILHNYHKAVISIHNGNQANIKNVTYKNITVEDAKMGRGDGKEVLIELTTTFSSTWSEGHGTTALGSIDGVTIENLLVLDGNSKCHISLVGCLDSREKYKDTIHKISNVTLTDIQIFDDVLNINDSRISTNEYVENFKVERTNKPITGSTFCKLYDDSIYGTHYIIH